MELLPHVNLAELVPLVEILDDIEKKFGADMKIAAGVQGGNTVVKTRKEGPKGRQSVRVTRGRVPNVKWRALNDAYLNVHPRFRPLPHASSITVTQHADVSKFAQSTWQAGELHRLRLTGRNISAALGLEGNGRAARSVFQHLCGRKQFPLDYSYFNEMKSITCDVVTGTQREAVRWNLREDQGSLLTSCSEPGLGVQICHASKSAGTRLVMYANSASSLGKGWFLRPASTVSKNPDDVFLVSKMHGFVAVPEGKEKGSRVVMQRMERLISRKKVATAIWTLQKGSDESFFLQSKWSGAYMSIASEPAGLNVGVGRNGELENEVWRLNNKGTSEKSQGPTHILHEEALDKKVLETFDRPVRQVYRSAKDAALQWGGCQEASALLCLMNELKDAECFEECGCILLENQPRDALRKYGIQDIASLPLLGASPDGIVRNRDGSSAVVEIKCRSPFVCINDGAAESQGRNGQKSKKKKKKKKGNDNDNNTMFEVNPANEQKFVKPDHIPQVLGSGMADAVEPGSASMPKNEEAISAQDAMANFVSSRSDGRGKDSLAKAGGHADADKDFYNNFDTKKLFG
eukprot:g3292.t1